MQKPKVKRSPKKEFDYDLKLARQMEDYNGKQERILGKARCRCCHRDFDLVRGLFICPFSGEKLVLISFMSTDYINGHTKGYQKNPEKTYGWLRMLMDSDLLGG